MEEDCERNGGRVRDNTRSARQVEAAEGPGEEVDGELPPEVSSRKDPSSARRSRSRSPGVEAADGGGPRERRLAGELFLLGVVVLVLITVAKVTLALFLLAQS